MHFGSVSGGSTWRSAPIEQVAEYSPVLALARARKCQLTPMTLPIVMTFTDSSTLVTTQASWNLGQTNDRVIRQFMVVQSVDFNIQSTAFAGTIGKSVQDFYYEYQSGIGIEIEIRGNPGYPVSLDTQTPIDALCNNIKSEWPDGWVLNYSQAPMVRCGANIALQAFPTTVTVTFCVWTPSPLEGAYYINLSDSCALEELEDMGFDLDPRAPDRRGKGPLKMKRSRGSSIE